MEAPSRFAAEVRLGDDEALLEVNHPYSYRLGEDVYLTSYDMASGNESKYCVFTSCDTTVEIYNGGRHIDDVGGSCSLYLLMVRKKCVNLKKV